MDLDALLQPRDDEDPSGEDLEYDLEFTELEIAAQPGEERQAGDEIITGDGPDYKDVKAKALGILGRSHDLRAAVYLAEAELRLSGLPGFAEATTYVNRCLHDWWDTCHPQLDADDDDDPTMRINAVYMLADAQRIVRGLRRAPLTKSRTFGALSLRHMDVADGKITAPADMENVPDAASLSAAFQDTDDEILQKNAAAATTALADIRAISAKFDAETPGQGPEHIGSETGGYRTLIATLEDISARLIAATGGEVAPAQEDDMAQDAMPDSAGAAPASNGGGATGAINSPTDVQNALDRIMAYYARNEPSSPVPILLARAKKLVSADFLTIMKDMAPNGVDNVYLIGGLEDDE